MVRGKVCRLDDKLEPVSAYQLKKQTGTNGFVMEIGM